MLNNEIFYKTYHLKKDRAPIQIIYLVHDLCSSHKSLESFIEKYDLFTQDPTLMIAIDLPGHGYHPGPRGHMESYQYSLKSLAKVICETSAAQNVQKRSILSIGNGISFSLACCVQNHLGVNHLIDNVVAIDPVLSLKNKISSISHLIKKNKVLMKFMRKGKVNLNSVSSKVQSLNLEQVSYSFIEEYREMTQYLNSRSYFIDAPTLFLFTSTFEEEKMELTLLFQRGIDSEYKKTVYLDEDDFLSKKTVSIIQNFLDG